MAVMVGLVVVLLVLAVASWVAAWVGIRAHNRLQARISAMPGGDEPAAMWPLEVDDTDAGPYLRGATVASALTGRR